ncbi:MAG: hypothetical protein ACYS9C_13220 [Planctomycetota bacterium]|jgi:hypothetical protein
MKINCVYVLVIALLLIGGCSSGESYVKAGYDFTRLDRIAIADVQGDVSGEAAKNQIADFFVLELMKKGYTPIERAQVQSLLDEYEFQASDLTTDEGAARAGRILNVPVVLVVNIPNFGEEMSMTAKMIDVEDGSVLWAGSGLGSTGRSLATILGAAGGAAAGVVVAGGDTDDRTIGGVAGGVLGGVAGRALSPQKAQKAREMIKKMCESLPYRYPR